MAASKPLHLKIEWNGELKAGEDLSPKFIISGQGLQSLDKISCELDPRLPQSFWLSNPINEVYNVGQDWWFTERLSLKTADGSALRGCYTIKISTQFQTFQDGQLVKANYVTTIFLQVDDTTSNPITVKATGTPLVRVRGNFGPVNIVADGDPTIDITPPVFTPVSKDQTNPNNYSEVDLEPCFAIPNAAMNNSILYITAKLPDGQKRFFQIAARQCVKLGRARVAQGNIVASDFVYRLFGSDDLNPDPVAHFLSHRISRNQLSMTLAGKGDGLILENLGTNIRYRLNGQEADLVRNQPMLVDWNDLFDNNGLPTPMSLKINGFSSIILEKFSSQPVWNDSIENDLMNHFIIPGDPINWLWNIGTARNVNSIRLRHSATVDSSNIHFLKELIRQREKESYNPNVSDDSPYWTSDLMANKEECHLVVRMLTIGNNPETDAICFPQLSQLRQATLYFCDNHFGLINHLTTIKYQQYGQENELSKGRCLPLQPGMEFTIGDINFHIYESYSKYREIVNMLAREN